VSLCEAVKTSQIEQRWV